jgi:outer membrane protein TolC
MRKLLLVATVIGLTFGASIARAAGAPETTPRPITFKEAVDRAVARNPSVQRAAAEILRAQALLNETTASIYPGVTGGVTATALSYSSQFSGQRATAQTQLVSNVGVSSLLYAPAQWALRVQVRDQQHVAELAAADVNRQIAVATAQAALSVIARQRVLDANLRARDVAHAHYELAHQQQVLGSGSRLNELRAQQSLSADEALVEEAAGGLYLAQEALGVLVADEGPLNIIDEPVFGVPTSFDAAVAAMPEQRTDLRLAGAREAAAARVLGDSWKDRLPSVSGLFQPQWQQPGTLFQPEWTWRGQVVASIPVFDSGYRSARRAERQVLFDESKIAQSALLRQVMSDVRGATDSAGRAEHVVAAARAAAAQAREVVDIVNVSFKVGASTNIEVIDAQRASRDADTAVAIAENQLRQAQLAVLVALGQFP